MRSTINGKLFRPAQVAHDGSKKGKKDKKGKKFFFCLFCSFCPFCFPPRKPIARPLAQVELFLILLSMLVLSPLAAVSQTATTTTVSGTVLDPQGATIVAATVTLIDTATNQERATITDAAGRYSLYALNPGRYRVKIEAPGFKTIEVKDVTAEVSKVATINVAMELGEILIVQNIVAGAQSQLQTADASVGVVFGEESLKRLPNLTRQADSLFSLQPATTVAGEFAGARRDQSAISLDGVDVSDNSTGQPQSIIPTPVESLHELRVVVANANATFVPSSGGQIVLVTRSGTNELRGSAYLYHTNGATAANSWTNNRVGVKRPFLLDNRFGASLGAPLRKDQTFFFASYEGRDNPDSMTVRRIVPTELYRSGTARFWTTTGGLFPTTLIGTLNPDGIKQQDRRRIGVNPKVLEYLQLYPLPNDSTIGALNTSGFTFAAPTRLDYHLGSVRLDHVFNKHWSGSARLTASREVRSDATQVDLRRQAPAAGNIQRPRNAVASAIWSPSPSVTNEARISWLGRHQSREAMTPQAFAGLDVPVRLFGQQYSGLDNLVDFDSERARQYSIKGAILQFSDTLSWIRGAHNLQFGGSFRHIHSTNARNHKANSPLTTPVVLVGLGCPAPRPTPNQDPFGGLFLEGSLYPVCTLMGRIHQFPSVLITRDADLNLQPFGSPLRSKSRIEEWFFHFSDTWRAHSSLTITYGLNYNLQQPPVEAEGRQTVLTFKDTGRLVSFKQYIRDKMAAAASGAVYNPDFAYLPVRQAGRNTAFNTDYTNLAPRLSVAWNPYFKSGQSNWLAKLFGEGKTVIRGGYSLVFDRTNTLGTIDLPSLGIGFSQTVPRDLGTLDHRIGTDGPTPLPTAPATLTPPIIPDKFDRVYNITAFYFPQISSFTVDPFIRTPRSHVVDFTIQRELPRAMILETGYVGRFASDLYVNGNLNSVPIMQRDPKSGQTLAEAYDAIVAAFRARTRPVPPQPYFENLYAPGMTNYIERIYSSYLTGDNLGYLQRELDLNVLAGAFPGPILTNLQVPELLVRTSGAVSNYHGLVISLRRRFTDGLGFDLNYTLSKSLDQSSISTQSYVNPLQSSFFPEIDYGSSLFDIRHLFKASGLYELPFGKGERLSFGSRALNRSISGWFTAGIFTAHSGLPLTVIQGGDGFGGAYVERLQREAGLANITGALNFTGAIPLPNSRFYTGAHAGVAGSLNVGYNGDPSRKGSGLNLFADPEAAYKSFRPVMVSQDRRHGRGALRGLSRWNLDLTIGKETKLMDSVKLTLSFDFFNVFNHVIFNDPRLDLRSPSDFGVLSSQFNTPRRVQIGARIEF
jgi:hypothetical protein